MVEDMATSEEAQQLRAQIELAIAMADRFGFTLVAARLEHAFDGLAGSPGSV